MWQATASARVRLPDSHGVPGVPRVHGPAVHPDVFRTWTPLGC